MIRRNFAILFLLIALTGCALAKTDTPYTREALATQTLVEKYIGATLNQDADSLMGLYADDLIYMDYGGNLGPTTKGNLDYVVRYWDPGADPDVKFTSYIITPDGRFAAVNTIQFGTSTLSSKKVSTPGVVILEFEDSKIISETWYYNAYAFH